LVDLTTLTFTFWL